MYRHTTTTNLLTQTSLLKIALVAREKSSSKQISEGTDLCEAYIRKMLNTHQTYFQFTGYMLNERKNRQVRLYLVRPDVIETLNRNIDELQKLLKEGDKPVPSAGTVQQVVYKNPYDQLIREAQIVECKIGQTFMFGEGHSEEYLAWAKQQRLARKSRRAHVGVADYAAF